MMVGSYLEEVFAILRAGLAAHGPPQQDTAKVGREVEVGCWVIAALLKNHIHNPPIGEFTPLCSVCNE